MPNPAYPALSTGFVVQLPWEESDCFNTRSSDMESGLRYSSYQRAAPKKRWKIEYSVLTDAEAANLKSFFQQMNGQTNLFDFTSPRDHTTYTNCRFEQDSLEITHKQKNVNACTVQIYQP